MLIEIYKGVEIHHDAKTDVFYCPSLTLVISGTTKKPQVVQCNMLQQTRDKIDALLNTSMHKPVVKKGWVTDSDRTEFEEVTVLWFSMITGRCNVTTKDGRNIEIRLDNLQRYGRDKILLLDCKENRELFKLLQKNKQAIDKLKKEVSCTGGKLIEMKLEHFGLQKKQ